MAPSLYRLQQSQLSTAVSSYKLPARTPRARLPVFGAPQRMRHIAHTTTGSGADGESASIPPPGGRTYPEAQYDLRAAMASAASKSAKARAERAFFMPVQPAFRNELILGT